VSSRRPARGPRARRAPEGARHVDGPQVAENDLVAAVLGERVDEIDEPLDPPPVDGRDAVERLQPAWPAGESGRATPMTAAGKRGSIPMRPCAPRCRARATSASSAGDVTSTALAVSLELRVTGLPALARDDALDLGKLVTSSPSIARMRSPGFELAVGRLARDDDAHRRRQELLSSRKTDV
jgi:hypothetical protein